MANPTSVHSFAQRLSAMPKLLDKVGIASAKYHAVACREVIMEGISKANLVDKLLDVTHIIKKKMMSTRVRTPLMFKGDNEKKSMINGLKVIKVQKRYRLIPYGNHYSGKKQSLIWTIHEKGAVVPVTEKMRNFWRAVFGITLRKDKKFILIKPRFPMKKGYIRYLKSKNKDEANKQLADAVKSLITNAKTNIKSDTEAWEKRAKEAMAES